MTAAPGRRSSTFTRLLRHGFTDASAAERLLDSPELAPLRDDPVLLEALGGTADPDLALLGLVRLLEAQQSPGARRELLDTLIAAKPLRDRLLGVLGASTALADHLARHPDDWQALVMYEAYDLHPGVEEFEAGLAAPGHAVRRKRFGLVGHGVPPAYARPSKPLRAQGVPPPVSESLSNHKRFNRVRTPPRAGSA